MLSLASPLHKVSCGTPPPLHPPDGTVGNGGHSCKNVSSFSVSFTQSQVYIVSRGAPFAPRRTFPFLISWLQAYSLLPECRRRQAHMSSVPASLLRRRLMVL